MNPLRPNTIMKAFLFAALALVLAAPAAARPILDVNEPSSGLISQYGWGAAATYAKQIGADDLLSQYSWGAAATYAKQTEGDDPLSQYGWGAAATFAKQSAGKVAVLGRQGTAFEQFAKGISLTARAQQEAAARR